MAPAQTPRAFLRAAAERLADRAVRRVTPLIPSQTLRRALNVRVEELTDRMVAVLNIPHYWAVYVHDGRASFSAEGNRTLIYFRDPRQDPRIGNRGFPERAAQITHLTKAGLLEGYRLNKAHLAAGGDIYDAPMVRVKTVGSVTGSYFFSRGLARFLMEEGAIEISRNFDGYVQSIVDDGLHEKSTAFGRLPSF